MKHIFIAENVAYAAKQGGGTISGYNEVNLLQKGAIAFLLPDGTLIPTVSPATTIANNRQFYIAIGTGSSTIGAKISMLIDRTMRQYTKTAYAAATLQKSFLGEDSAGNGALNLPGTLIPGEVAEILIVDSTGPVMNTWEARKYRYSHVIKNGDTQSTIITSLINKVNAHSEAIVTATVVGTQDGIEFEAKEVGTTFVVAGNEILSDATTTVPPTSPAVSFHPGFGTPLGVRKLEFECEPHEGKSNEVWTPALYWSYPTQVNQSLTYDLYDMVWNTDNLTAHAPKVATKQHVIIAFPASGTAQSGVEGILTALVQLSTAL